MPERYDTATITTLGGHLALDFANTIEDRTSAVPDDTLRTPEDLRRFGIRHRLLARTSGPADQEDLRTARDLRDGLIELFTAHVEHGATSRQARRGLAQHVAKAWTRVELTGDTGALHLTWPPRTPRTVTDRVSHAALELLIGPHADRLSRCENDECGWFFLDTSKNHSRRWCSMRGCGTRAKTIRRRRTS